MAANVIKEVLSNVFRIKVPLPDNVLRRVNSYVVKGPDRNLVIDTGMLHPECLRVMKEALQALSVDPNRSDFFLTHMHADHMGLVTEVAQENSKVFISDPDGTFARAWNYSMSLSWAVENGYPGAELRAHFERNATPVFRQDWIGDFTPVRDGDVLTVGEYRLECVATPGHTQGHMCLYDRERRVLFSGDHVLGDISPNIVGWAGGPNPLLDYLSSLAKVRTMAIDLMLPGHRGPIHIPRKRIDELTSHHQRRLEEVVALLSRDGRTAYDVASGMTWDWNGGDWRLWPAIQRFFATGEALSHLLYLNGCGMVAAEKTEGTTRFRRAPAD